MPLAVYNIELLVAKSVQQFDNANFPTIKGACSLSGQDTFRWLHVYSLKNNNWIGLKFSGLIKTHQATQHLGKACQSLCLIELVNYLDIISVHHQKILKLATPNKMTKLRLFHQSTNWSPRWGIMARLMYV